MRILQLISQNTLGGAETFAYALSAELARRGHEVLLLSNRDNGPLFERERPRGLAVRALERRSRLDPRIVTFLTGAVRRFRPDVIHAHNFEANTWARSLGLLFPRLNVFCHDHSGRKIRQPAHRIWMDRTLFRRCAGVFVVNEELARLLRTRHHVPESILHVVPNGIDVARFRRPAGIERDPMEAVSIASLTDVKNHAGLIDAWREVCGANPRAHLTLVGEGPLRAELEQRVRQAGLEEAVAFAGLSRDVRPYLWRASIFVLFSHREALPLSLLEAMAAGLACVAPEVGGIPEAMTDKVTGRLVPPEDGAALARTLVELYSSPKQREALGARAIEDVEKRYGLGSCVDRIEEAYRAACPRVATPC